MFRPSRNSAQENVFFLSSASPWLQGGGWARIRLGCMKPWPSPVYNRIGLPAFRLEAFGSRALWRTTLFLARKIEEHRERVGTFSAPALRGSAMPRSRHILP